MVLGLENYHLIVREANIDFLAKVFSFNDLREALLERLKVQYLLEMKLLHLNK